jgi:lipopolysaccharide export LptBFGC system permease protein LptF
MVFVLHRYVFRELLKILVPATVALTLIMSLLSILRPIQEYGIGPGQVMPILGYSLPITLTFVLPLSTLFAVALVYGRLASDNELDACKASGISLWTLVYPGLALAIIVAIINLILSFHVVPTYVQRGEAAIKADAKQILFRNIQRRGFYELPPKGKHIIYADQASVKNGMLYGVVVISLDKSRVSRITTAESASVKFSSHDKFNEVQLVVNRLYQVDADNEQWAYFERFPINHPFPSLLGDNIQFKKIGEMKKIEANPLEFYPIEQAARNSHAQLVIELLAHNISDKITDSNDTYYELFGEPNSIRFRADGCQANTNPDSEAKELYLSGQVEVQQYDTDTGQPVQKWFCSEAILRAESDEFEMPIKMELYSPRWQRPDGTEGFAAGQRFIRGLLLPAELSHKLETHSVLHSAAPQASASILKTEPSPKLKYLQRILQSTIQEAMVDIKAEIHTRLALGVSCVPLILIGIALGIIFRGGHLLTAFGISAVPAMMLVVCLMMGKNVAKHEELSLTGGIMLIWFGFVLLSLLATGLYHKLLKN